MRGLPEAEGMGMGRWEVGCFLDPFVVVGEIGRALSKELFIQTIFAESSLYSWETQLTGARAREGSVPCAEPYSCPYLLTLEKSSLKDLPNGKKISVVRKTDLPRM